MRVLRVDFYFFAPECPSLRPSLRFDPLGGYMICFADEPPLLGRHFKASKSLHCVLCLGLIFLVDKIGQNMHISIYIFCLCLSSSLRLQAVISCTCFADPKTFPGDVVAQSHCTHMFLFYYVIIPMYFCDQKKNIAESLFIFSLIYSRSCY